MIIHNASFMMERGREPEFIEWFRATRLPGISYAPTGPRAPVLSAMREAGGIDYRKAEAQTVAWQVVFDDVERARRWSAETFAGIAAAFEERFGPEAMVFTSIFETID